MGVKWCGGDQVGGGEQCVYQQGVCVSNFEEFGLDNNSTEVFGAGRVDGEVVGLLEDLREVFNN